MFISALINHTSLAKTPRPPKTRTGQDIFIYPLYVPLPTHTHLPTCLLSTAWHLPERVLLPPFRVSTRAGQDQRKRHEVTRLKGHCFVPPIALVLRGIQQHQL